MKEFNIKIYYLFILIVTLVIYGNTINHQFTIDDNRIIVPNKDVHDFNIASLVSHSTYYGTNGVNYGAYRPVTMLTYSFLWNIGSKKNHALPFHATCIILYGLTCILLLKLLRLIFKETNINLLFATCIFFVIMPIHTEVVANVKSLDEILCLLFGILSLIFYYKEDSTNKIIYVGLFSFLSLLSKETGVIFPLIIIFNTLLKTKKDIKNIITNTSLLVVYIFIRNVFLKPIPKVKLLAEDNSIILIKNQLNLIATKIYMFGLYISNCIYIEQFNWDYSFVIPEKTFFDISVILTIILIVVGTIFIIKYKNDEVLRTSFFITIIPILITSSIILKLPSTFAERFSYIPSFGILLIIIVLINKIKNINITLISLGILLFSFINIPKAYTRALAWKDGRSLNSFEMNYSKSRRVLLSESVFLYQKYEEMKDNNYIKNETKNALLDSIERMSFNVINMYPQTIDYIPFFYVGSIMSLKSDLNTAEKYLLIAENNCIKHPNYGKIDSTTYANIENKLGFIYGKRNDYDKALKCYLKAFEYNPTHIPVMNNIGSIYYSKNQFKEAKIFFSNVIAIDSKNEKALKYLELLKDK